MSIHPSTNHLLKLTTHKSQFDVDPEPLNWGAADPIERGPVVATVSKPGKRNAIGVHSGTYSVYRALALAAKSAPPGFKPDFTNTLPPCEIGPFPVWSEPGRIVSMDPWGHVPQAIFADRLASGDLDLRPTIAVTKSHLELPEIQSAVESGLLKADGLILKKDGAISTTKAAVEPVWHLPAVAKRFGCEETELRRVIYEQTGGMFPELVTRPDLKLFLPPLNGVTVYMMGDVSSISDPSKPLAVRLHDENYDSELFGNNASTGRNWLCFGIEEGVKAAQAGGAGVIVYARQEGNALGEVSKFLVHNARKTLGDSVANFHDQAARVTGAADVRHYELCADVLLWLGVTKVDSFVTSSDQKCEALKAAGIEIVKRVTVPSAQLAAEAQIEVDASSPKALRPPAKRQRSGTNMQQGVRLAPTTLTTQGSNENLGALGARRRVTLTTHIGQYNADPLPLSWGDADPRKRGAVVATMLAKGRRNAIGAHNGPYSVFRAVGVAKGQINATVPLDLEYTEPAATIGPFEAWYDPEKIVALDPWGHLPCQKTCELGAVSRERDVPTQPTIAIASAELNMTEIVAAVNAGRLSCDGKILSNGGTLLHCIKCSIEPVWYLPGIARRFHLEEAVLRRKLFEHTGGMFPELVTRADLKVFLPPIGGCTALIFGDPASIPDPNKPLTVRVHDECNGSDIFGSDICTCRPYLTHGIEECVKSAQEGGAGLIVYNRKEGRALGEVTKFMVYNARKRQEGGDSAQNYFKRTEVIAGVQDMRFQELMPDPLLWLGVKKIDKFISMSNMKYDAIIASGITIVERVDIPEELIPADAKVEIDAKMYAGYFSGNKQVKTWDELNTTIGREL